MITDVLSHFYSFTVYKNNFTSYDTKCFGALHYFSPLSKSLNLSFLYAVRNLLFKQIGRNATLYSVVNETGTIK